MPLREDLLNPISGEKPGGEDLRYAPVYDKIKEARREEEDLNQGVWTHERKLADFPLVIKLAQEALATKSKDLQVAAWLCEALLKKEGIGSFREGLAVCTGLLTKFWDHLYPQLDDGDAELRVSPLDWLSSKMEDPIRRVKVNGAGHAFYQHRDSRKVPYENQCKNDAERKARDKILKEGKIAPEACDKAFVETPKAFYLQAEKDIDACIAEIKRLDEVCQEKFGDIAPGWSKLNGAISEVRQLIHSLLEKKRETEPDPVEAAAPADAASDAASEGGDIPVPAGGGGGAAAAPARAVSASSSSNFVIPGLTSQDPADRRDAIAAVAQTAALLRRIDPTSPAPYLMLRGLRWGELRAAADVKALEAPPTDIRHHIKSLALAGKWKDLLESAENVMALPCSRAWLDLQRFCVEACVALGSSYNAIAIAIRSELRALLRDFPQLLTTTLMDDTPAANAETLAWLKEVMEEPPGVPPRQIPFLDDGVAHGWQKKFVDAYALAQEALRAGQEQKAFEIMSRDIERQRSGRGRFLRKVQFVQLCVAANKEAIAQPIIEDLVATVENHKLDDWEEKDWVAAVLVTLLKSSKKLQADNAGKQKMFDRICRLDPAQALTM